MTIEDQIKNDYFDWMTDIVCGGRYAKDISYRKLLTHLHDTEFIYILPMDENRAWDGIDLRDRFAYDYGISRDTEMYLDGPCSILEMMIALAIRCEEQYMDDPLTGNRTRQWFWRMISSLGLGGITDDRYDYSFVDEVLTRFLTREYAPDGRGGLFTVKNRRQDLRNVEIWYQLNWYLDTIT